MVFRHAAAGLSLAVLAVFAPPVSRAAAPPAEPPCPKALAGPNPGLTVPADRGAPYRLARPLSWNGTLTCPPTGAPRPGAPTHHPAKPHQTPSTTPSQKGQ